MSEEMENAGMEQNELLKRMKAIASDLWGAAGAEDEPEETAGKPEVPVRRRPQQIGIGNLWKTADETVDWTDALAHVMPTDGLTSRKLWSFYHQQAEKVLAGDLDAYTNVLKTSNPLGELTAFAEGIQMRAPDPDRLEATFGCKEEHMKTDRKKYLSAMALRIARDLFACLPVREVSVKAVDKGKTVMETVYHRQQLQHRNFMFLDPVVLAEECGAVFAGEEDLTDPE